MRPGSGMFFFSHFHPNPKNTQRTWCAFLSHTPTGFHSFIHSCISNRAAWTHWNETWKDFRATVSSDASFWVDSIFSRKIWKYSCSCKGACFALFPPNNTAVSLCASASTGLFSCGLAADSVLAAAARGSSGWTGSPAAVSRMKNKKINASKWEETRAVTSRGRRSIKEEHTEGGGEEEEEEEEPIRRLLQNQGTDGRSQTGSPGDTSVRLTHPDANRPLKELHGATEGLWDVSGQFQAFNKHHNQGLMWWGPWLNTERDQVVFWIVYHS